MIKVYADGGSRGNPGPAGIGFVIFQDNKLIFKYSEFIGKATNNVAEYTAVEHALRWLVSNLTMKQGSNETISFYLDSQLVVQQLSGNWKIKDQNLKEIILKIKMLEAKLPVKVSYNKIPRDNNYQADSLVNQALDKVLY